MTIERYNRSKLFHKFASIFAVVWIVTIFLFFIIYPKFKESESDLYANFFLFILVLGFISFFSMAIFEALSSQYSTKQTTTQTNITIEQPKLKKKYKWKIDNNPLFIPFGLSLLVIAFLLGRMTLGNFEPSKQEYLSSPTERVIRVVVTPTGQVVSQVVKPKRVPVLLPNGKSTAYCLDEYANEIIRYQSEGIPDSSEEISDVKTDLGSCQNRCVDSYNTTVGICDLGGYLDCYSGALSRKSDCMTKCNDTAKGNINEGQKQYEAALRTLADLLEKYCTHTP